MDVYIPAVVLGNVESSWKDRNLSGWERTYHFILFG